MSLPVNAMISPGNTGVTMPKPIESMSTATKMNPSARVFDGVSVMRGPR